VTSQSAKRKWEEGAMEEKMRVLEKKASRLRTLCKVDDERENVRVPRLLKPAHHLHHLLQTEVAEIVEQKPHRTVKSSALRIKAVDH
jgi:hypothetical protein